ncbi:OmpA family protein [Roseomonas sp. AR75]|uniref:OmpA family protein n=1 Tax=Roseomonas sp. AR75 TaxID=2562311 RepID=UPI00148573FA|nr:OmpA family protein [Roseomonas sp. AR75]
MRRILALALLWPGLALGQPREFSCVGAEALEDDVFAVPFQQGSDRLRDVARSGIEAAAALAKAEPHRNICVLGHADRRLGAESSTQLAARRARAVSQALSERGVERDRIRAEARVTAFSGRVQEPGARAVTIVVMPAAPREAQR